MNHNTATTTTHNRILRRLIAVSAALLGMATFAFAGVAGAQDEPSLDQVVAIFEGTTIDDWTDQGFVLEPVCVSAPEGAPFEGAMGFHAVNPDRIGFDVVADEPGLLLIDGAGGVMGFEWEVPDQSHDRPVLFGQPFDDSAPHPGFDAQHWSLHVWAIDNPAGQFAPFNRAVACPAPAQVAGEIEELALTGSDAQRSVGAIGITVLPGGLLMTEASCRLRVTT